MITTWLATLHTNRLQILGSIFLTLPRRHRRWRGFVFFGVIGGNEETEAGFLFFHGGIQNRLHVDATQEQGARELQRMHRVADEIGTTGVLLLMPVLSPRCLASLRNKRELACTLLPVLVHAPTPARLLEQRRSWKERGPRYTQSQVRCI